MKLDRKCADEIVRALNGEWTWTIDFVPESECEFWAHKELNEKMKALGRIAEAVGGKDKLEALVMGEMVRKEIGL